MNIIHKVFKYSRELERKDMVRNKYIMNAYKKDLRNYRILNMNHILKNKLHNELSNHIIKFVNEHKEVLLIANIVNHKITQMQLRSIDSKNFTVMGKQTSVPYGLGMLSDDFKYGDLIIVVEGTSDRDSLIEFYPNVIAVLSDGISMIQSRLLEHLTNRVLIMYDNDKPGRIGNSRDKYKFKKMGYEVEEFSYPEGLEDPGQLLELRYKGELFEAEYIENYLRNWIEGLL